MALMITDECISCGVCLPECPNEAIVDDDGFFESAADVVRSALAFLMPPGVGSFAR